MTSLRPRMTEDMQVRNLALNTQMSYVQQVSLFARHFDKSPEQLGPEDIRAYQVYLTNEKKLATGSVLIAVAALRFAMKRDFTTHRRWALRLFLVASASWFFRIGFFLTLVVFGPIGFDPTTFTGPLLTFWSLAQYLLPLGVLELYLLAQKHSGAMRRMATAAVMFVLTLAMGAGIGAVAMASWAPRVKAGLDPRRSVAQTLSTTIASSGMDAAMKQYQELKAAAPTAYNFDESELNNLGYRFVRKNKFKEAIRIFQMNVEAYPKSANTYDSLAEGYMDNGENALAIANYQKSLQLNPKNRNAEVMLQKLKAR